MSTGTVVGWFEDGASLAVDLDTRLDSVGRPTPSAAVAWPQPDSTDAPPVVVGQIAHAPPEVAERAPYPYCGEQGPGESNAKLGCFLDNVLFGQPVEVILRIAGVEGGEVVRLYRFADHGAVIRYQLAEDVWTRQAGALLLGGSDGGWDFDPWDPGEVIR